MPGLVCVKHGLKLFNGKSGVYAIEYKDQEKTKPYKIWNVDRYVCPHSGCDVQVLTGFSDCCKGEWEDDFEELLALIKDNPKNEIVDYC